MSDRFWKLASEVAEAIGSNNGTGTIAAALREVAGEEETRWAVSVGTVQQEKLAAVAELAAATYDLNLRSEQFADLGREFDAARAELAHFRGRDGDPTHCLLCGATLGDEGRYVCVVTCADKTEEWGPLADAWERGHGRAPFFQLVEVVAPTPDAGE